MTEPVETVATKRKRYPEEFKQEAVELLRTSGRPLGQIARELGVSAATLRRWRKQAEIDTREREGLFSEEPRRIRHERHMVKRTRVWVSLGMAAVAGAAAVVFLLVPLACSGGDESADRDGNTGTAANAEQPVEGSFVGKVSGMDAFLAIVAAPAEEGADERPIQLYVSDGADLSEWLTGSISDNSFVAKSEAGSAEAEGTLQDDSVEGTLKLSEDETVRYRARRPGGAAGLYDLTVSPAGKLKGASAAGLGVRGNIRLEEGAGNLKLADGRKLTFEVTPADELDGLKAGQVLLIVLPNGELRGAGRSRPAAAVSGFLIRSSES